MSDVVVVQGLKHVTFHLEVRAHCRCASGHHLWPRLGSVKRPSLTYKKRLAMAMGRAGIRLRVPLNLPDIKPQIGRLLHTALAT